MDKETKRQFEKIENILDSLVSENYELECRVRDLEEKE